MGTCHPKQQGTNLPQSGSKKGKKPNMQAFTDLKEKIQSLNPIMCLRRVREGILHTAQSIITAHDSIDEASQLCQKVQKFGGLLQNFAYINIVGAKMQEIAAEIPPKLQEAKPYLADIYNVCLELKEKHIKIINCIDTLDQFYKMIEKGNKKQYIGDILSNGIRVLQWVIDNCPNFKCKVPEVQKNQKLGALLLALNTLHIISQKITNVENAVLNKSFGKYKLADLIKKKDGDDGKKQEKKAQKDNSGLGGKMKIGFGGFSGASFQEKLLNQAIKQAENFVNDKITKVFDALVEKLVIGNINEKFEIPDDSFLDQQKEPQNEQNDQLNKAQKEDQEDQQQDGYHRGTVGQMAQQFEEKKEPVKKGKWFYIDIVVDQESKKVNLNETNGKFVIQKQEAQGEKKGVFQKLKEKGMELAKQKIEEIVKQQLE